MHIGRIADRVVDDDRALLDGADAEDRDLRLVDQRQAVERAEDARVRDREGAALHFVGIQLLRPRAGGEVVDRPAQAEQVLLVGVADHRHDQPVVERDRDARG